VLRIRILHRKYYFFFVAAPSVSLWVTYRLASPLLWNYGVNVIERTLEKTFSKRKEDWRIQGKHPHSGRKRLLSRVRASLTNNNGFWIGWLDLLTPSFTVTLNYTQLQQLAISDCLRLAPFWLDCDCLLFWSSFYCDLLGSDLRITHFWFMNELWMMNAEWRLIYEWMNEWIYLKVKVMLRPKVSRPVCLEPIWGLRPDVYCCQTVAGLLLWGALSDERTGLSFARVTVISINKSVVSMYSLHFTCY
jgi:hypothetical protein